MNTETNVQQKYLLEELTWPGITQTEIALTYAFVLRDCGESADWHRINAAIKERWKGKTALERVKKLAWAKIELWRHL